MGLIRDQDKDNRTYTRPILGRVRDQNYGTCLGLEPWDLPETIEPGDLFETRIKGLIID